MAWVGEVSEEIVNWTGAGVDVLEPRANNSKHSETPVFYLFGPQFFDFFRRTAAPAQWVKPEPARITHISAGELVVGENGVRIDATGLNDVSPTTAFGPANKNKFDDEEGSGVSEVVQFAGRVPRWCVKDAYLSKKLGNEDASGA